MSNLPIGRHSRASRQLVGGFGKNPNTEREHESALSKRGARLPARRTRQRV